MRLFNSKLNIKTATWLGIFVLLVAVFVLVPQLVNAQASLGIEAIDDTGLGQGDLKLLIARIIQVLLGFIGLIAVIIIIYGGYVWMTSQGAEEKITQAKRILVNAVIGLVIILSAFAIVTYVINTLNEATGVGTSGEGRNNYSLNPGSLGAGVLQNVYPEPGATDVPRNTLVMVSFKENMDVATIINQDSQPAICTNVPETTICGFLQELSGQPTVLFTNRVTEQALDADQVVVMTSDNRNFVFDPVEYLGSADGYTDYSVNLTDKLDKADGSPAFLAGGYMWSFEVSNLLDLTPPQITSVLPVSPPVAFKNATIQINFNEAVNVVSATGKSIVTEGGELNLEGGSFNNITVSYQDQLGQVYYVSGNFTIGNQFRTVEFISDQSCTDQTGNPVAENSCGQVPTCLPGNAEIKIIAIAAQVDESGNTIDIFSGLTDATGNSLDGNQNGLSEGPLLDNYTSIFNTNDEMDLTPPEIVEPLEPVAGDGTVARNKRIKATFSELLRSSTINSDSFRVFETACGTAADNFPEDFSCYPEGGFAIYSQLYNDEGTEVSQAVLKTYYPYFNPLTSYNSRLTSNIQDLYQNCFNPSVGPE